MKHQHYIRVINAINIIIILFKRYNF